MLKVNNKVIKISSGRKTMTNRRFSLQERFQSLELASCKNSIKKKRKDLDFTQFGCHPFLFYSCFLIRNQPKVGPIQIRLDSTWKRTVIWTIEVGLIEGFI